MAFKIQTVIRRRHRPQGADSQSKRGMEVGEVGKGGVGMDIPCSVQTMF